MIAEKMRGLSAHHAIASYIGNELTTEQMTESQIERAACTYAKSLGMLAYKFTSPGRSGVPDRLLITNNGRVFFIEFKCATGKLSALQHNEHRIMRMHGAAVYTVYDFNQAKDLIDGYAGKPKGGHWREIGFGEGDLDYENKKGNK